MPISPALSTFPSTLAHPPFRPHARNRPLPPVRSCSRRFPSASWPSRRISNPSLQSSPRRPLLVFHPLPALVLALVLPPLSAARAAEALHYDCRAVTETIVIDGELTEDAWRDADVIPFYVPITHATPQTPTQGRLCWDQNYLYVAFDGVDEDLKGSQTVRDSSVYLDDVFETFIQPGPYEAGYHNFEINILGTVYDAHNGTIGSAYNCAGLLFAIRRVGTLNNSTDHDTGWRMEVAIPFADLVGMGKPRPDLGDVWPFHLARYDYSVYIAGGKELSSCALLSQAKFHNRADWIELRFLAALPPPPPLSALVVR